MTLFNRMVVCTRQVDGLPGSKRWLIFSVLLISLLSACSFNTIYRHLDLIIPVYINNLVELDELEDRVDEKVIDFLAWHQQEQLPVYSAWLQQTRSLISKRQSGSLSVQALTSHIDKLTEIYQPLRVKINRQMAWFLPLLNADQVDELFASLQQDNNAYIQEYVVLSVKEKQLAYVKRMQEQFTHWTGYLTDKQQQIINQSAVHFSSLADKRLKARIQWQQQTRQLLLDKPEGISEKLTFLFNQLAEKQEEEYSDINMSNREQLAKTVLKFLSTLEEPQANNIREKLDYYTDLIHEFRQHHWK